MSMTGYSDLSSNKCHLFGHCVGELAENPATSWFYGGYISTDGVVDTLTTSFVSMKGFLASLAVTVEISTVKIVITLW